MSPEIDDSSNVCKNTLLEPSFADTLRKILVILPSNKVTVRVRTFCSSRSLHFSSLSTIELPIIEIGGLGLVFTLEALSSDYTSSCLSTCLIFGILEPTNKWHYIVMKDPF